MTPAGSDSASDLFPRKEIAGAVGEALRRADRRDALLPWFLGLGIALLALAFPTERLWGGMDLVRAAEGSVRGLGISPVILRWLAEEEDLERAAFLFSALATLLLLPATRALLLTIGFPHDIARQGLFLTALCPITLLAATLPVELAASLLGSTLVLRELFRLRRSMANLAHWRVTLVLFLAFLLDPENLLLLPAAALALSRIGQGPGVPRNARGISLVLVFVWILWLLLGGSGAPAADAQAALLRTLLAGAQGPDLWLFLSWLVWLPVAFGVTSLGWACLLRGKRTQEEAPPPRFVLAALALALAPILAGSPADGPSLSFLLPLGVVGLADHLLRIEQETAARQRAAILIASQALLSALALLLLRVSDPLQQWRGMARTALSTGDLVVSDDPDHRYLMTQRFRLEVLAPDEPDLTTRLQAEHAAGRLIWWDGPKPSPTLPGSLLPPAGP